MFTLECIYINHSFPLMLGAGVPGYQPVQLVHSLIHALSSSSSKISPIIGQEQQPSAIEKNPCVVINHLQPVIKVRSPIL